MSTKPAERVMQVSKGHCHSQGLGGGLLQSQDIGKLSEYYVVKQMGET